MSEVKVWTWVYAGPRKEKLLICGEEAGVGQGC